MIALSLTNLRLLHVGQARQTQAQQAIEGAHVQDDQLLSQNELLLHALVGEKADLVPS